MELINPGIGLIFWMTLSFSILVFILLKYIWPAILTALHQREEHISQSLDAAKKAHEEMQLLKADNEALLQEARQERQKILNEARNMQKSIVDEARGKAESEAERIITSAKSQIREEQKQAIAELRRDIGNLSIDIAEKILKKELSPDNKQQEVINQFIKEIELN